MQRAKSSYMLGMPPAWFAMWLATTSASLAKEVSRLIELQLKGLQREKIASKSVARHSVAFVVTTLEEAIDVANEIAAEHLTMLEQGEADLAISVLNVVPVDEHRFASYLLPLFQMLAACAPTFDIERTDTIEIRQLVQHPLLLPNPSYATRNLFDAACRLAGVRPNVLVESGAAHALMALAEA